MNDGTPASGSTARPVAFDPEAGLRLPTRDADLPQRLQAQRELGLAELAQGKIEPEFDEFAAELASSAGMPYAMVNLVTGEQVFAGLYADASAPPVGRTMPCDYGYCPQVLQRRLALVLPDVCAYPRFKGNDVVDRIGIRTYAGAPLIHNGTVLGTVCVVGISPRDQTSAHQYLALIKRRRDALMDLIYQRAARHGIRAPR